MATAANAVIGHNSPPPIETFKLHIEDLMLEANNWLDGEPILNQAQADEVGRLLAQLREARKGADAQRAAEKKPHDDAGKAVQAAWKPLLERVDLAEQTAKKALAPFLAAEQAKRDAEAAAARAIAEEAQRKAQEALRAAEASNLAAREEAEALLKEASKAERAANKAEGTRATATGGARAVSLRTVWYATITDRRAALNHYLKVSPAAFVDLLQELANHEARNGPRNAPGVEFTSEQVAQ